MSLSDRKVQQTLRKDFVCAWVNTEGDPVAGASFAHPPSDPPPTCIRGNGEHNVQLLVLTPGGELLNVVAGYLGPDELLEELRFALEVGATLRETEPTDRERTLVVAQEGFVERLEQRDFDGPLGDWERRRALADHRFVAAHPLLPVQGFRAEMLVGNGRTFFGSSQGGKPTERIGEGADEAEEELERLRRRQRRDTDS